VASRVTKYVTFFLEAYLFVLHYILFHPFTKTVKEFDQIFREITPQSYFNIFRDLIIYLRDLIKSPFLSSPCDIYIQLSVACKDLPLYEIIINLLSPSDYYMYHTF
jgi:hypothetical protein